MENNEELPVIEFENPQEPDINYLQVIGTPEEEAEKKRIQDSVVMTTTEDLPVIQIGRPTSYSQDVADRLCEQLSQGKSLRKVCEAEDMPCAATVFNWLAKNEQFLEQYTQAKEASSEAMNEMLIDIGDQAIEHAEEADPKAAGAVVSAYKLKADNMKWYMSKVKPKKYGDKLDVTSDGKAIKGNALIIQEFGGNEAGSK